MVKILTVVVPAYNMGSYLNRCMDSVLLKGLLDDIEVIIVNDGSQDDSEAIARQYSDRFPDTARLINQQNGGHGSAVNTGIAAASGVYVRILDADDWFDAKAFIFLVKKLKQRYSRNLTTDAIITNYVYENAYDKSRKVMRYSNALPQDTEFTGEKFDKLNVYQYLNMHTLTYRTQMLKDFGLRLQHHTYYVDNEYVYIPIPYVKTYIYYNIDLYRYFIGRPDQSITLESCLKRTDHHERVLKRLILYYDMEKLELPDYKIRYMFKELNKLIMIYASMLTVSNDKQMIDKKLEFFAWLKETAPYVYKMTCNKINIRILRSKSPAAVFTNNVIYNTLRNMIKFQ